MTQNAYEATQEPVAIIGYGTAGVNAVIGLRTAGYTGTIRVFSDTDLPPYSPILTSYYAGGEKTYEECFPWSAEELAELNFELMANEPVVELNPEAHRIRTERGEYSYSKCVIATGARPMTFGFPATEGYEPLVLRTMADAERLRAALENGAGKRVLVSGASMIALKCVEACLNRGARVSLVGMNAHILDFSALPETAARFEKGLAAQGLAMRFGQTIKAVAVCGEGDTRTLEVEFSGGETEEFDEIIVAHGVRSDFSFIEAGSLEIDRGLVVDEFMRTSNPDVYAAGDVAQAFELVTGEKRILGIWKTAAVQGQVAGAAIAAELSGEAPNPARAWKGAIAANTIAVNGTLFISGGWMEAGENRTVEIRETESMTVACVFADMPRGGRRLVFYNVAADTDEAGSVAYDTGAMLSLRLEAGCRS